MVKKDVCTKHFVKAVTQISEINKRLETTGGGYTREVVIALTGHVIPGFWEAPAMTMVELLR